MSWLCSGLPFLRQAEMDGAKKTMTAYAALLLDSLQLYEDSDTGSTCADSTCTSVCMEQSDRRVMEVSFFV